MSRSNVTYLALALALVLATAAGCGDDSTGSSASGLTKQEASEALLAPPDLTARVTDANWAYADQPLPCDDQKAPGADSDVSPQYTVGVALDSNDVSASLVEEIRSFTSAAQATDYTALVRSGLACGTTQVDDGTGKMTELTISEPRDISADVDADDATLWSLHTSAADVTFVNAQVGAAIAHFYFASSAGEDLSSLDKPLIVVATAVAKITHA